jgi:Ca2+-binding RTX toxin-like protein
MAFAFLFLGLLPLMFFADLLVGSDDDADDDAKASEPVASGNGTILSDIFTADADADAGSDVLQPITDDETPIAGDEPDPDDVLAPVEDDEVPIAGDEVDPDNVLDPVDEPGEDAPAPGDATTLQSLLAAATDFDTGVGWIGSYGPETEVVMLGTDGSHADPDDGVDGTGTGELGDHNGTPVLASDVPVRVISGGEGDNAIELGDAPAYAFGGEGDDTITGGEGAAAIFGGAGEDVLAASDSTQGTWIDGGDGNDTIVGGAGTDILYGGAHGAGDEAVGDDDLISGGAGDDTIAGGYGADTLLGGEGDDVIDHLGRAEQEISVPHHEFSWHIDNQADVLDGGAGNDVLIMDRADTATGGEGNDTFWIYFDSASGSGAAEIDDFTVGEDFLRITLNPDLDHGDLALTVDPSTDGLDGIVRVNGETIAILRGTPGASTADMRVEVTDNIFG